MKRSLLIFLLLILYLVCVKLAVARFGIQFAHPSQAEAFSWTAIGIIALLGLLGTIATTRTGFPDFWDTTISFRRKLLFPLLAGLFVGLVAVGIEAVFGLSKIIAAKMGTVSVHIPFPSSAIVYPAAAILVSIVQYLVPIPILVWIISNVILRRKFQKQVFIGIGILAALVEPVSQAAMLKDNTALFGSVFIFVFGANLLQVYIFRKIGFLSTVFFRLFFYVVWHIIGPLFV